MDNNEQIDKDFIITCLNEHEEGSISINELIALITCELESAKNEKYLE